MEPEPPATIRVERERSMSGAVRHCTRFRGHSPARRESHPLCPVFPMQRETRLYTKGADLQIPSLPLDSGVELRLELHDGAGDCVASSFSDPSVNDAYRYQAETE